MTVRSGRIHVPFGIQEKNINRIDIVTLRHGPSSGTCHLSSDPRDDPTGECCLVLFVVRRKSDRPHHPLRLYMCRLQSCSRKLLATSPSQISSVC